MEAPSLAEVGVIFGGPSPEHDVSILTGLQALRCLSDAGYPVHALFWSKVGQWFEVEAGLEAADFVDGLPKGASPLQLVVGPDGGFQSAGRSRRVRRLPLEVVLVCCHGGPGEDGSLQAALDLSEIRYAGPTAAGAALTMDKLAFGAVVAHSGMPTLPRTLLLDDGEGVAFPPPYIVKPRFGGSSIGIDVVTDLQAARLLLRSNVHLSRGAVIEPYRPELFDLQIAVRSWPEFQASAIERPLKSGQGGSGRSEILSYGDKYSGGEGMVSAPRELPAKITTRVSEMVHASAFRIARLTALRGVARVDFLSDGTDVWVNEVNSIPGSLAKYLWIQPEVQFVDQLKALLEEAVKGGAQRFLSTGADGRILHGASSIASKLA
jgi:D-alanine-D-alanine ligase